MLVNFENSNIGLQVKFTNISAAPLAGQSFRWDFGDGNTSTEKDPVHVYDTSGSFFVKLEVIQTNSGVSVTAVKRLIRVTDKVKTQLSGSIYDLIDVYLSPDIFGEISFDTKRQFIEKWQLYLQPLVNHEIPIEEYNNEFYYEALENQLIMELAAYDYLSIIMSNSLKATSIAITDTHMGTNYDPDSESVTGSNGNVKKISTGPTEVEFFDNKETESETLKALEASGTLSMLKENLCMLAGRLDIILPICENDLLGVTKLPRVVNRRKAGPLGGPNPRYPVKR